MKYIHLMNGTLQYYTLFHTWKTTLGGTGDGRRAAIWELNRAQTTARGLLEALGCFQPGDAQNQVLQDGNLCPPLSWSCRAHVLSPPAPPFASGPVVNVSRGLGRKPNCVCVQFASHFGRRPSHPLIGHDEQSRWRQFQFFHGPRLRTPI